MITYSKETLYHFLCIACKKWWTIADRLPSKVICPHCGQCGKPQEQKEL